MSEPFGENYLDTSHGLLSLQKIKLTNKIPKEKALSSGSTKGFDI